MSYPDRAAESARYGRAHRAERDRWRPVVESGEAVCSRCHGGIAPGAAWDLDHTDDGAGYYGPAHASCNRAAGARTANAGRALVRGMTVRTWGEGGSDLRR